MIEFFTQDHKRRLILFIHGLTGSENTWKNSNGTTFPGLLSQDQTINDNFDIAYFNYYSKFFNITEQAGRVKKFLNKILSRPVSTTKKNVSIQDLAKHLHTEIEVKCQKYQEIIVIAHSMGGLITKGSISIDIEKNRVSKVKLFLSLAVPHHGSSLASPAKLLSNNVQLEQLKTLSDYGSKLCNIWQQNNLRPATKYFRGLYDEIVDENSAIAIDKIEQDIRTVPEDHESIAKPKDNNNTTFLGVSQYIHDYLNGGVQEDLLEILTLKNEDEYSDSLFVIKLLIADIHKSTVTDAKELFLNAEYMSKRFTSSFDQKHLQEIYTNIKTIYQDSYTKYLHGGFDNSGQFLSEVHDKIVRENEKTLKSKIYEIGVMHKKGMLHQLADELKGNVWWSETKDLEKLEE
ncbi:ABC-three component system protein [Microbulbifer sp. TRSA002]|uniref:ABC-three component system protein n=1 Tax=Microbulbifer sp. TRSA002 TaxID=3243382 RepID=UPI00403A0CE8